MPVCRFYSENFRGMPSGWVCLEKVNFLIGENSSGKSSFIHLCAITTSPEYGFSWDPLGVVESIDTPYDLISKACDSETVTIGILPDLSGLDLTSKEPDFGSLARIASYRVRDDKIYIESATLVSKFSLISIKYDDGSYWYAEHDADQISGIADGSVDLADIHKRFREGAGNLKRLDMEVDAPNYLDWRVALSIASRSVGRTVALDFFRPEGISGPLIYGPLRRHSQRLFHGNKLEFSGYGDHTPYIYKRMLDNDAAATKYLNEFGAKSGLFDGIEIERFSAKTGDKPFSLNVIKNGQHYYVDELGFGVSQILPIAIDVLAADSQHILLIQQPELHLHPRAQSEFGAFAHRHAAQAPILVIETHSDFVVDRFRYEQACASEERKISSKVIFFKHDDNSRRNISSEISIAADGSMIDCPSDYRDFFINESIKMLEYL